MTTSAVRLFRKIDGLFCVYKPAGVHWKLVRDTIETNILKGVNAFPPPPLPKEVRFLQASSSAATAEWEAPRGAETPAVTWTETKAVERRTPTWVPVLSKHPLVTGPEYRRVRVAVGHRLDAFSSGVLVLAVGNGTRVLNEVHTSAITRDYTLEGEFGTATDDFSHQGRVLERSTFGHINLDKMDRVLAMLQGANQKALLMYANVDMKSQEAYELATHGLLGPEGKSPPILTGLRCTHFQPPNFTLEVRCLNETQKYLRKIVHEIGLELRSTAVCKGVRRTRDGPFTVEDALTHRHWTTDDIIEAVRHYHATKKRKRKRKTDRVTATSASQAGEERSTL
ncbi:pseudouridylate synthase TRUB2, mitochondrial [Neosynchiropus ocellatus]